MGQCACDVGYSGSECENDDGDPPPHAAKRLQAAGTLDKLKPLVEEANQLLHSDNSSQVVQRLLH